MVEGVAGQMILQGGSGTGSLDASTWKSVFYDTGSKAEQDQPVKGQDQPNKEQEKSK